MMNDTQQFWCFLITGEIDDKTGVFLSCYSAGSSLGDALGKAFLAIDSEGVRNTKLIEATMLDPDNFEIPSKAQKISESTFLNPPHYFDLNYNDPENNDYVFCPPTGVVLDGAEKDFSSELIQEQFVAFDINEDGVYELQMVVDQTRLIEIFFNCIKNLESIDSFGMLISSLWTDKSEVFWKSTMLDNKEKIINFLQNHPHETTENGFVNLNIFSSITQTQLILCDHKKIKLYTKSEDVFRKFIGTIIGYGFKQTMEFYDIEYGYHHWHYRPANSLEYDVFAEILRANKFDVYYR